MSNDALAVGPLDHLGLSARVGGPDEAGVTLRLVEPRGQICLRGDASDKKFLNATAKAVGTAVPVKANTVASSGDRSVIWMSCDEWLVVTPRDEREQIEKELSAGLRKLHAAVVDVSDSRAIVELSGAGAREVLSKGTGLDLHPSVFGPGQCARTGFARTNVLIVQTDFDAASRAATYELYEHRSFCAYLWTWLEDAAREFGCRIAA